MITKDFIDNELIGSKKHITKSDKQKMWLENRHYRNSFNLNTSNNKYRFRAFLRRSNDFIEDFSIGLIWINAANYVNIARPIILLRCQGPHDGCQPLGTDIHHAFHTHEITVCDIMERRYSKPSYKGITDDFSSFQSALFYFVNRCGIINAYDYSDFDSMAQISLSESTQGGDFNG